MASAELFEVGAKVRANVVAICCYLTLTQFGSVNAYLAMKLHDSLKDREAVLVLPVIGAYNTLRLELILLPNLMHTLESDIAHSTHTNTPT